MPVCLITAHLQSPVANWSPLHLDALLLARSVEAEHHLSRTSPESQIYYPPIPIARIDVLGTWCYICSAWIWPEDAKPGREHITRRKDAEDLEWRAGRWSPRAGPERACDVIVPTVEAPYVSWLAVGRADGIRAALRRCVAIGPYRRAGLGRVSRWYVEVVRYLSPRDVLIDPETGLARRHLPPQWVQPQVAIEYGAYRPPYWHPAMWEERVGMGTPCVLRDEVLARLEELR